MKKEDFEKKYAGKNVPYRVDVNSRGIPGNINIRITLGNILPKYGMYDGDKWDNIIPVDPRYYGIIKRYYQLSEEDMDSMSENEFWNRFAGLIADDMASKLAGEQQLF